MKITKHIKRRTGQPYWIATGEPIELAALNPASWQPARFGGGLICYDETAARAAINCETSGVEHTAGTDPDDETEEKMDYNSMSVAELRKLVRANGWTGAEVLDANKAELVAYLQTGEKPTRAAAGQDLGNVGQQLAELIATIGGKGATVDEEQVRAIIRQELAGATKRIEVLLPDGRIEQAGVQHKDFETLLKLAAVRMDSMLVGPAGSGKTTVCHAVADALGLPFYAFSVGMQTTKTDLLGFVDAHGTYRETVLYQAYKDGGLYLLDEIDAGNSNVLTLLNAMLANGQYIFPNGERVERHPDFICFAAANTFGRGADRQYVGRNQLDAATLDRFVVKDFDYDEALEKVLTGNDDWTARVQAYRRAAFDLKERVVISPRASIKGATLLAAGFKLAEVEELTVWKGLERAVIQKIKSAANIG